MNTRTSLCAAAVAGIVGAGAIADGILNGDFEAADPTDWKGTVQNGILPPDDPINFVELTSDDGVETYARILVATDDPGPRAARLNQNFEVCADGGFLTVTFDARSFGTGQRLIQIGDVSWDIPATSGAPEDGGNWARCLTVSLPIVPGPCGDDGVESIDVGLTYWVLDQVRIGDDCADGVGELHIDNVRCAITAESRTNLDLVEACIQTAMFARNEVFTAGLGATPPPPCIDIPAACTADIDHSGAIDFGDILKILARWGPCSPFCCCSADIDRSGDVGFSDLIAILAAWGTGCP